MKMAFILICIALIFVPSARGQTTGGETMAVVRQFIEAFNTGGPKATAAICTQPALILDGMAPHVWQGKTACADWARDVEVESKHESVSDYFVTIGDPEKNEIKGNSAYVIVPATMKFKVRGKEVTQTGAAFIIALKKLPVGWRVSGWAWSKGSIAAPSGSLAKVKPL